jgi:hypothetical protein
MERVGEVAVLVLMFDDDAPAGVGSESFGLAH